LAQPTHVSYRAEQLGVSATTKKLEWQFRPRDRKSFVLGVLIFQAALLVAAEFIVDIWLRKEISLAPSVVDRMFVFRISIAFSVFTMTAMILYLASRRYKDALEETNAELGCEVTRQVNSGLAKRNALIFGLAKLADYRDTDTGAHLERIGLYARVLASSMSEHHEEIDARWIDRIVLASSLHDIGKVGIPDAILLKPGRLTPEERVEMEKHALIGADTLLAIRAKLGPDEFIDMGVEIALQHHEKWDGSGYPFGLKGREISLPARIVALADFYDAVTSKRVYKDAMTHTEASELIAKLNGSHFDPQVAQAFFANEREFNAIREHNAQPDSESLQFIQLEQVARKFIEETGTDGYSKAA
jgi:response regulator RpfG family c-di-GMP phosphodiesterase